MLPVTCCVCVVREGRVESKDVLHRKRIKKDKSHHQSIVMVWSCEGLRGSPPRLRAGNGRGAALLFSGEL